MPQTSMNAATGRVRINSSGVVTAVEVVYFGSLVWVVA